MAELVEAAKSGDLVRVRRCVLERTGCDVNFRCPPDGSTALYWAACGGHVTVCDWLIGHGADVRLATTKSGSTALHGSADRGHHDCVDLLVKRGSHVDAQTTTNGDTALHLAAYRGHLDVCRLLVANDADASIVNRQGRTALDEAKIKGHGDVCRLLLLLSRHNNSHLRRQDFGLFAKSYSAELSDDKIPAAEEKRLSVEFFRDDFHRHHHHHHHRPVALDGGPPTPSSSFFAVSHPHDPRPSTDLPFDDPGRQPPPSTTGPEDSVNQQLRLKVASLERYAGALETQLRLRDGSVDRLRAENAELRRQLEKTTAEEKSSAAAQREREEELNRLRSQTDECAARTEQAIRELDETRRRYRQLEAVVFGQDMTGIGPTEDTT